ncbi:MAG: transglutaminase domain-containing protein [Proteobacteria bacterium]|nr:transglutaminase domain-containing protein [Pseudomonadota bacterium]
MIKEPGSLGGERYRTVDEARIVELLALDGWAGELRDDRGHAARLAARAALERCVATGLGFTAGEGGGRRFDPVEAVNHLAWIGLARGDPTWRAHCVATERARAWEAHGGAPAGDADAPPPPPATLGARAYEVTIRRTFSLAGRSPGQPLRLRLPVPIEDAALDQLQVEALTPPDLAVETEIATARLDARLNAPDAAEVTLGVRARFVARPSVGAPAAPLAPGEAELYTRPSEGLIKLSPRIRDLADGLAGPRATPKAAIARFWAFMLDELTAGAIHYDRLAPAAPLDTLLDGGWYDCQAGSALMAALCRARGIPARLVTGYLLHEMSPAFHTWLEAWTEDEGWRPYDLWCWDLSAGGREAGWRDHFFGRLDHRMVVERPPRLFGGAGQVRLPPAWRMLTAPTADGTRVTFEDVDTGALAWREDIVVKRLGA